MRTALALAGKEELDFDRAPHPSPLLAHEGNNQRTPTSVTINKESADLVTIDYGPPDLSDKERFEYVFAHIRGDYRAVYLDSDVTPEYFPIRGSGLVTYEWKDLFDASGMTFAKADERIATDRDSRGPWIPAYPEVIITLAIVPTPNVIESWFVGTGSHLKTPGTHHKKPDGLGLSKQTLMRLHRVPRDNRKHHHLFVAIREVERVPYMTTLVPR